MSDKSDAILKIIRLPSSKFALKVGVAAGAVYYVKEQGVWKDSAESTKLYGKICNATSPYLKQATSQLPVEIPALPKTDRMSYVLKQYWNCGVTATFTFLGDLPNHVNSWTKAGVDAAKSNEGIKNFIESFSSSPPPIEPTKK